MYPTSVSVDANPFSFLVIQPHIPLLLCKPLPWNTLLCFLYPCSLSCVQMIDQTPFWLAIYLSSPLQWKFRRSASLEVLKSPDQSCLIEWSSSAISAGCCPLHFALDHFMDKQMSRCLVIIHFLVLSQWDVSERTIFRKVQFNINRKTIFSNIFLYNHIC